MVSLTRTSLIALTILSFLGLISATNYFPAVWAFAWQVPFAVATKWGTRGTSVITGGLATWVHIYDIASNCLTQEGDTVDKWDCANSVITSAFGMGLAVLNYKTVTSWTKRNTNNADSILNLIPDSVKITDMKVFGEPIIANTSSPTLRRRDLHALADPINVDYNGSMPFTFVMHHKTSDGAKVIPVFFATDGHSAEILHISRSESNDTLSARNGFNGFNYVYTGGVYVEGNSDPTCYWDDVVNWLNTGNAQSTPLWDIIYLSQNEAMLGHAFLYEVDGYMDGQFAMVGMTTPVPTGWLTGWNWCFGVNPTNC